MILRTTLSWSLGSGPALFSRMTILEMEKSGVVLRESGTEVTALDKVYLCHHSSSLA
jgi:hypothetical protein